MLGERHILWLQSQFDSSIFVHMSQAHRHPAASDSRSDPSGLVGPVGTDAPAGYLDGLVRYVRTLADVGKGLVLQMGAAAQRRTGSAERVHVDLDLAWDLVGRAMRWIRALQARLAAEALAEATEIDVPKQRTILTAGPIAPANGQVSVDRGRRVAAQSAATLLADGGIDGIPTIKVMAQICADLGAAAKLLAQGDALEQVVAIARAARAMLDGGGVTDAAETRPWDGVRVEVAQCLPPSAATELRAPDTG
jgi:hypothetical protein